MVNFERQYCPCCNADITSSASTYISMDCPACGKKIYKAKYGWAKTQPTNPIIYLLIVIITLFLICGIFFLLDYMRII